MTALVYDKGRYTESMARTIEEYKPNVLVGFMKPQSEGTRKADIYHQSIEYFVAKGGAAITFCDNFSIRRCEWSVPGAFWYDGRGDISFVTNDDNRLGC